MGDPTTPSHQCRVELALSHLPRAQIHPLILLGQRKLRETYI